MAVIVMMHVDMIVGFGQSGILIVSVGGIWVI